MKLFGKNIPVMVDLELPSGTLWADRNVGADRPETFGDYFPYDKIKGDMAENERDGATSVLGERYHTPTFEQINELLTVCKHEWTTLNDVKGIRITGPNGNSIFLPAGGYRFYYSAAIADGYYWSVTPNGNEEICYCTDNSPCILYWGKNNQARGFLVRPVAIKKALNSFLF